MQIYYNEGLGDGQVHLPSIHDQKWSAK